MADQDRPETGQEYLAHCWWEALDELLVIIYSDNAAADRVAAAKAILDYTSSINVGLGDPFIPSARPMHSHDEEGEDE